MKIKDDFKFKDGVTGITITVIKGKKLDRLHLDIEKPEGEFVSNRDFFFTKTGKFDGTGSAVGS